MRPGCGPPRLPDHVGAALTPAPVRPGPLARPPPAESTALWHPLCRAPRRAPEVPGPRARQGLPVRHPTPLPYPAPLSAPGPSALGGTFSFCFRGVSTFSMAVSESKSASLRSFPGIVQHEQFRPTGQVHRVERKRQYYPVRGPTFVTSGSKAIPAEAESPREAGAHVVAPKYRLLRLVGHTEFPALRAWSRRLQLGGNALGKRWPDFP